MAPHVVSAAVTAMRKAAYPAISITELDGEFGLQLRSSGSGDVTMRLITGDA
jgi:hypothetical protein